MKDNRKCAGLQCWYPIDQFPYDGDYSIAYFEAKGLPLPTHQLLAKPRPMEREIDLLENYTGCCG